MKETRTEKKHIKDTSTTPSRLKSYARSIGVGVYALYVLRCADGTLYTGITANLKRRAREHNGSKLGAKYTGSRRPVKLVFSKRFRTRGAALRAEVKMKALTRIEKLLIVRRARREPAAKTSETSRPTK